MSEGPRETVERLRTELGRAQAEITRAAAVLTLLETRADGVRRGSDAGDAERVTTAFGRYLRGEDRPDTLAYLTGSYVETEGGHSSALKAPRSPTTSAVDGFVRDLWTYVEGGAVDPGTLIDDFEGVVTDGTADDCEALVALFEHVIAAARGYRDDRQTRLNGPDADGQSGGPGKLQALLDGLDDDLAPFADEPVALLPVRLETRFVYPNDDSPRADQLAGTAATLLDHNRTAPAEQELRVRVYPDQIHVDTHEDGLTVQEEQWGRNFWAQVWFACQPPTTTVHSVDGQPTQAAVHDYAREKIPADLRPMLDDLSENWQGRFSTEYDAFYRDIKERAWNQVVERFGRERGAYVVHATAPKSHAQAMLTGYAEGGNPFDIAGTVSGPPTTGIDDGIGTDDTGSDDRVPALEFPGVDLRPGSWSQPPVASLLPDRWIAVGRWRGVDEGDGDTRTVRVTGDAIQHPLPVGPSPERVGSEALEETPGDAPPGMEWMADWPAAKGAGMGLTITSEDLNGTNPGEAVFEELIVVGVRASQSGDAATDALESLFEAHHYTDGLELLERGTPSNNSEAGDAGYTPKDEPSESVAEECGPLLSEFGDFSDGDLLARALGIAASGEGMDHVFAHVEGADGRSQADARHMNSLLWSGTIGYSLRNLLVDNRWTNRDSIWEGRSGPEQGTAKSFPHRNPATELGETLKEVDAWRRHFVRYVRAGGPFPPLRVGTVPYGILPARTLPDEPGGGSPARNGKLADKIGRREQFEPVDDQVRTPEGQFRLDTSKVQLSASVTGESSGPAKGGGAVDPTGTGESVDTGAPAPEESVETAADETSTTTDTTETAAEEATTDTGETGATTGPSVGEVSASGYSVTVPESTTQIDQDLYGSSFDPATPRRAKTMQSVSTGFRLPDGGSGVATRTRQRAFRTDEEFPGRLASWLGRLTDAWDDGAENVERVGGPSTGSDVVERILGREANADDFVREVLEGYDALLTDPDIDEARAESLTEETRERVRQMLIDNDVQSLDPRIAWMHPPVRSLFGEDTRGEQLQLSGDRPVSDVTDGRESDYLRYLYHEPFGFLRNMGLPVGLDAISLDRERVKEITGWGDEIDSLSDRQLFMHVWLTNPEHGKFSAIAAYAGDTPITYEASSEEANVYRDKRYNLYRTGGASLQNTLFKQLTRFSVLQGYVGGRIRLGLKWGDLDLPSDNAFLSPDRNPNARSADEIEEIEAETGEENVVAPDYTQQPVPDPSVVDGDTKTVWEFLEESVPAERLDRYDDDYGGSYANELFQSCSPRYDDPSLDPRLQEILDAAAYLESRDTDDLGRLFTETLDLASHRLDAWWTSLATRRLFEHRETRETDFCDGAEFAFVGDQFERGEDTEALPEPEPESESDTGDGAQSSTGTRFGVGGKTRFGAVENMQSVSKQFGSFSFGGTTGESGTSGEDGDDAETDGGETFERAGGERNEPATDSPVTYVGAYGYVEDLRSDALADGLEPEHSEYIHAPSPQHATTAAVLRSGRTNHTDESGDGELAELLDIDLSPGRVRAARQVLDGIRQGQMLGDLLGYRFERRLLERSKSYNEDNAGTIALPRYKFTLRRAFPGVEGQLDHGDGEDGDEQIEVGTAAAASDVLDGYRLFTKWQEYDDGEKDRFFQNIPYEGENASTLAAATTSAEQSALEGILEEIAAIVDATADLLIAENVHQLGKGNFARAGGGIDDLVKGKPVADPEVAQTPRDDVGVTHRLGVAFGDPANVGVATTWTADSGVLDPNGLPGAGDEATGPDVSLTLQTRPEAEPNLNDWLDDLLPAPDRVSCRAALEWDETRAAASGTVVTPTSEGVVSIGDLDFQPDLVVLGLAHGVPKGGAAGPASHYGVTSGVAVRTETGADQCSTSVATDLTGSDAGGVVDEDHALHAHLHEDDGDHGLLRGSVRFTDDGFDVAFDDVATRGPAAEGLVVTYRAFALENADNVEVGTFTTDAGTGSDSISLEVDADQVRLFGTTLATKTGGTVTTTGAAGFSEGMAVARDGVTQHAVGTSVDPSSGGHVAGARDDRTLHLPFAAGGSVAGTTSVAVTGLGESLDLNYTSTHAGAASDASRVVTYVALGSDDAPTPAVGTLDGTRTAGDTATIRTGFRPGQIELVALPDAASVNSDGPVTVGGLATGVATGVGDQQVVGHVVRADGDGPVGVGAETGGDVIEFPDLAADGTVADADTVRVTGLSETGFTMTFPTVTDGDQVIAWRAWPEEPASVTHVAETGVTLSELNLSPLDATYLTQQNQKAGASQLETRMGYHLARNPPSHNPPVPDTATVTLEFDATAPEASGDDPLSVGAFLEVVAGLREVIQEGRPMTGEDLGHPSETDDAGYTDYSITELRGRADTAQARLAAVRRVLDDRIGLLDPAVAGARSITEQVDALHDSVRTFTREVPFDGLVSASNAITESLESDSGALVTALEDLRSHLPAGSTDREARDPDLDVAPAPGQEVAGEGLPPNTTLSLSVWSTSNAEWFTRSTQVGTDGDGEFTTTLDFSGVRPGTGFVAVLDDGTSVERVVEGAVLVPEDATEVDAAPGMIVPGEADVNGATTLDVSVTEVGASSPLATTQVDTDAVGRFSVTVDASGHAPWTLFAVEATDGGTTVYEGLASVRADPAGVVEDSNLLSALLWIDARADAFDPFGDGATADLDAAVADETDWGAIRAELTTLRDLNGKTGGGEDGTPPQSTIDAVAKLVSEGDEPALESLDQTAVDAAVASVTAVVDALGIADYFDVTGRPDRSGGTGFWSVRAAIEDEDAQARLASLLDQHTRAIEGDIAAFAFAPELEALLVRARLGVYPEGDDDVKRLARTLRALADFLPTAVDDPALAALTDPEAFVRHFRALLYEPDALPTGAERSTFLSDFRTLVRQPVLGGIGGIDEVFEVAGPEPPFYNRDRLLLDVQGKQPRSGDERDRERERDLEREREEFVRDVTEAARDEFEREALVWKDGLRALDPKATPPGTPVTDCRFLLEGFRRAVLPAYLDGLDTQSLLPGTSASRQQFSKDVSNRLSTLGQVVDEQRGHVDAAREAGAFHDALRTGLLETLRRALLRASYFGVYGSVPRSPSGGQPDDETVLVTQARTVTEAVAERYETATGYDPATRPDPPEGEPATSVDEQVARLEAIFGEAFQVLPTVEPTNGAELTATFGRSDDLQAGDPMAAETWLQRVARVRDESARFRRGLSYAEAVTGERHRDLQVGQLPHRQGERWVGLDGQDPEPGRLSLVMQHAAGFDGDYGRVAGLFVDELVENVPGETETTGVALNYDDPDAMAPNSILLALPPEEGGWTTDHLVDVVTDTMELARYRMVDLEDIDEFGTLLPLLSFPRNDRLRPDAPSVDVDRIRTFQAARPEWGTVNVTLPELTLNAQLFTGNGEQGGESQ
ncbi:hypothetical protein [Halorientalis pallida]|uniref:Uncharacterized protein n=1 Tax=Halorientalis pallida TaxID=2479928 RepID=A0A498L0S0_9EURY|nr:hypothetical protein [Halorientalis pallida]RXK48654.1 hypothetical protein EAF64_13350 [Halorientalis pallida]